MRLWSIHPKYLDPQGLVALWREGLLAKKVLEGKTIGYRRHPQLIRFYRSADPILQINVFLEEVYDESAARGYHFDKTKIDGQNTGFVQKMEVPAGQILYEFSFLQEKLSRRNPQKYHENQQVNHIEINSVFTAVEGGTAEWEKVKPLRTAYGI